MLVLSKALSPYILADSQCFANIVFYRLTGSGQRPAGACTWGPLLPGMGASNPLPQGQLLPVVYTCQFHSGESRKINIYADVYSKPNQLADATRGTAYTANLTAGGLPPYKLTVSNSNLPASLTVNNVANQGPVLTGTPGSGDAGSFAFDLYCEDSNRFLAPPTA
jgi:hypothetical protein